MVVTRSNLKPSNEFILVMEPLFGKGISNNVCGSTFVNNIDPLTYRHCILNEVDDEIQIPRDATFTIAPPYHIDLG